MIVLSYAGVLPKISKECFVADNAVLVGDVSLGEASSVWFGASIRAEKGPVKIGERSNIQDNSVIHVDSGGSCIIGSGVSIGHGAIIHGSSVGENSLVGMGAILLNDSKIGRSCLVGAGALVTQGTEIPDEMLVLGSPARAVRKLTRDEISGILENARRYDELRTEYIKMK